MSAKIPVVFKNTNNCKLFGIYQKASTGKSRDVAIILLSPGIKCRVAPHRLYVKMARQFNDLGFDVLRFDPEGIGDSEGEICEDLAADVHASIEIGRFIESTTAALDWMQQEHGYNRIILSGLCGGAITGLLTAAQDDRVVALLGLGIPAVSSAMKRLNPYKYMSKGELRGLRHGYLENILNLKRWWRFLTFQSDYRIIFKSLFFSNRPTESSEKDEHDLNSDTDNIHSNLNPVFLKSMFAMLQASKDMCLIFSEIDRLYWEFEEKFLLPHKQEFEKYRELCQISIIKNANHIFSFPEWEKDMMTHAGKWLTDTFFDEE